ncbi:Glucan endo-1,3-beta-glucosidase [Quillaja saponaria]|uniref:glucan endo-1,3-beta-D-glucosidase n=1 Tax=Quillaja saponaria TaxID=32244 RepID=A0AAD7VNC7_QUISA|nr:Glucan endo-1,3-beta-glucosidase [Quillaja saponaria]
MLFSFLMTLGLICDNLPKADVAVKFLQAKKFQKVRIFNPNPDVLNALRGSNIQVMVGVPDQDLEKLSSDPALATEWVKTNIIPYTPVVTFTYISVGNEIITGPIGQYALGAMKNLDAALKAANIGAKVSTSLAFQTLGTTYPPSSDPNNVRLDYALFTSTDTVVTDGQYHYNNLFDAQLDALFVAMEKAGGQNVDVVVSETGWPTAGNGDIATNSNAQTYVSRLMQHVTSGAGTPRRPNRHFETYVFALFNENQKQGVTEQNFGLFYPNMTEVYHVDFPN